jgi:arginyl-tRNA synthetase
MHTLFQELENLLLPIVKNLFPGQQAVEIAACQEEFGHYQCNSPLKLSKLFKQNPREIAQKIVQSIGKNTLFAKIEIAGPGFINFSFSQEFINLRLQSMLKSSKIGVDEAINRKKIIVDFSSPNVAKELHVGHIRSTIIGDCICRVFEFIGHEVIRLNHIGDWGTQFGMLIAFLIEHKINILEQSPPPSLENLMSWYRASKKQFDEDPLFQKRAKLQVVLLQAEEKESLEIWKQICEISKKGFEEIYSLLGVKTIYRGESFYNSMLKQIVEELESKQIVTLSEGAKCIFIPNYEIPLMIQKSDGGFNYDTTDMAAMYHRIFIEKADRIIIVTDSGQSLHFQLIYEASKIAGWLDPAKTEFNHVGFGVVLGSDGKKFKTRSGDTEKLTDLLSEGISAAKSILDQKNPEASEEEKLSQAKIIGIDAIKYSDLSTNRIKDYLFSYEKMLQFEGNTAVFLLYSYVRINGILKKGGHEITLSGTNEPFEVKHVSEISLGIHLLRFPEMIELFTKDLFPNRITDYLYQLAELFNRFYRDCPILTSQEKNARLQLCILTQKVLKQGFDLLGLEAVEKL